MNHHMNFQANSTLSKEQSERKCINKAFKDSLSTKLNEVRLLS